MTKSKEFLDYAKNENISKQNQEIKELIEEINNFLDWKKFWDILLNSLTLVWKYTFWATYSVHWENQIKDISDFPWIKMESPYWKDVYNFKEWFNYIKNIDYIKKENIIFLNNILTDSLNFDYESHSKDLEKDEKIIYKTLSWKEIDDEMENFLNILNNWINKKFEASLIWYLFYLFVHIHPFFDWNWRTIRVLLEYIITKKLWCKIPCVFLNFYFNYTKNEHYMILEELNLKINWSLEKFIFSINKWIIEQIKISLKILKELDLYITKIIQELKEIWYKNEKSITEIYSNLHFENKKPYKDQDLENLLEYFMRKKWFKNYIYKWSIFYYDENFVKILKNRY